MASTGVSVSKDKVSSGDLTESRPGRLWVGADVTLAVQVGILLLSIEL
jgi:hypothetical protein